MASSTQCTTLLNRLASTTEKTKLLVMQESSCCRAKNLLLSFLRKSVSDPATRTFLILLQTDRTEFDHLPGLAIHSFFNEMCSKENASLADQLYAFGNACDRSKANRVFIDSLNPVFQIYDLREVHSLLTFLCGTCDSIVATVFDRALDSKQRALVRRLATAHLKLAPAGSKDRLRVSMIYKRKHRTLGYKVEKKEETIEFGNGSLKVVEKIAATGTKAEPSDDLSRLTFNVNLSEDEKRAKDKVQLPYVKTSVETKVYYIPDEFDDVDDEDPDDDLGI